MAKRIANGVNYRLLSHFELVGICEEYESQLAEEKHARWMAECEAAVLRRNERLRHPEVVPAGDEDEGYSCPVEGCWAEIDHPFTQAYCGGCGAKFDWHPEPDETFWDNLRDRQVDETLAAMERSEQ